MDSYEFKDLQRGDGLLQGSELRQLKIWEAASQIVTSKRKLNHIIVTANDARPFPGARIGREVPRAEPRIPIREHIEIEKRLLLLIR